VCKTLIESAEATLSVTHMMHRFGLNMRYLGLVYAQLVSKSMYSNQRHNLYMLFQVEAMMRVVKNHLRSQFRAVQIDAAKEDNESRLLAEGARVLNAFFGHCESITKWRELNPYVVDRLVKDFNFSQKHATQAFDSFFRSYTVREVNSSGLQARSPIKHAVLVRLNAKAGLGLSAVLLQELLASDTLGGRSFLHPTVFEDLDFEFEERVKNLDVVERASGVRLYLRGVQALGELNFSSGHEFLMRAFNVLESAIEGNPSDLFLCMLMGDICTAIAETVQHENLKAAAGGPGDDATQGRAAVFLERAGTYLQQAAAADVRCQPAQSKCGLHLARCGRLEEAQELLMRATELCLQQQLPVDQAALWELASVLERRGETDKAQRLRVQFKHFSGLREQWLQSQLESAAANDLQKTAPAASAGGRAGGSRNASVSGLPTPEPRTRPQGKKSPEDESAGNSRKKIGRIKSSSDVAAAPSPPAMHSPQMPSRKMGASGESDGRSVRGGKRKEETSSLPATPPTLPAGAKGSSRGAAPKSEAGSKSPRCPGSDEEDSEVAPGGTFARLKKKLTDIKKH
jgi:tetratricopeptide (TPR) repeat protein